MNLNLYIYRLQTLLQNAKSILIFVKKNPDRDCVGSALSLYLSLIQKGKQVKMISPDKLTVEFSDLFAVDKISDDLGKSGKNLVISFPYVEGSIEKVSYHIENNRFNLVVEPKGELTKVDQNQIEFFRAGEGADSFDLIFFIGCADSSDLGKFDASHKSLFGEKTSVIINNSNSNLTFGTINIVNPQDISISEIVTLIISKLNYPIDNDIAQNLMKGIKEKTNNFTRTSAESFEAAAILTRKIEAKPVMTQTFNNQPIKTQAKAPPDWLKPKIFRSSQENDDKDKGTVL